MYTQYTMNQATLPLEINSLLPSNHIIYSINQVVEDLDDTHYQLSANDFGRPGYPTKILLKALLFAYPEGIFSGREIEKMVQENLAMHWLTGKTVITYRTINRFRVSDTTKGIIRYLYCVFSIRLKQEKLIEGQSLFINGTLYAHGYIRRQKQVPDISSSLTCTILLIQLIEMVRRPCGLITSTKDKKLKSKKSFHLKKGLNCTGSEKSMSS